MLTIVTHEAKAEILTLIYTLYIYNRLRGKKMALKNVSKIDDKLTKIYENQITTNLSPGEWKDRSQVLLAQMNFIALNNKTFLNLT